MTPARLALLALAALLATGGAFWLSSQRHLDRAVERGDPVLPQLRAALNEVAEIRLSRGDGAAVTLRRAADGWSVVERDWRADAGKLRKLLLDLSALAVVEEKTHDPARYAVLGVEDVAAPSAGGTRVDVKTKAGAIQSLILGKPSGAREGYVRAVGAAPSYLARPQIAVEVNPSRWLDTALLDVAENDVRAVSLAGPGAPERTLEGAALPAALAAGLKGLALEDVRARPLDGANQATPAAPRARFITWDGLVVELTGREDGARRWVSVAARFDPAAARPRPAPTPASTPGSPGAPGTPGAAAAAPAPAAAPDAIRTRAGELVRRTDGREFEIPAYRFDTIFAADAGAR